MQVVENKYKNSHRINAYKYALESFTEKKRYCKILGQTMLKQKVKANSIKKGK